MWALRASFGTGREDGGRSREGNEGYGLETGRRASAARVPGSTAGKRIGRNSGRAARWKSKLWCGSISSSTYPSVSYGGGSYGRTERRPLRKSRRAKVTVKWRGVVEKGPETFHRLASVRLLSTAVLSHSLSQKRGGNRRGSKIQRRSRTKEAGDDTRPWITDAVKEHVCQSTVLKGAFTSYRR